MIAVHATAILLHARVDVFLFGAIPKPNPVFRLSDT